MRFPDRLLVEDERVVLHLHPHWKTLTSAVLVLLLTVGLASYGIASIPYPSLKLLIAIAAVILLVWFSGRRLVRWLTTHVVFTTDRVMIRIGLLKRHRWELPLGRITDVMYVSSLPDRIFRCGTLLIESAGDEDDEGGRLTLSDLPKARYVQSVLYELMEEEEARAWENDDEEDGDDEEFDEEFDNPRNSGNYRRRPAVIELDDPD